MSEARAGERVFVWVRFSGHGAESGIQLEMELAHVITMQDSRVKRLEDLLDRSEALGAVGLTAQRMGAPRRRWRTAARLLAALRT